MTYCCGDISYSCDLVDFASTRSRSAGLFNGSIGSAILRACSTGTLNSVGLLTSSPSAIFAVATLAALVVLSGNV